MEKNHIEGTVFNIQRFSIHDGPGIRTTFFMKGCNLHCLWCHNPESFEQNQQLFYVDNNCRRCGACVAACPKGLHRIGSNGHHLIDFTRCDGCFQCVKNCYYDGVVISGRKVDVATAWRYIMEERVYYSLSGGGVTFSGGECLLQMPFVLALLKKCHEEGIHTAVDTAGHVGIEVIKAVQPYTDLFLFDLKAIDTLVHKNLTGVGNEKILKNLEYLLEQANEIWIRIPVIPGLNDRQMSGIATYLENKPVKVELLPYHPFGIDKYGATGNKPTEVDTGPLKVMMRHLKSLFLEKGITLIDHNE